LKYRSYLSALICLWVLSIEFKLRVLEI